MYNTYKMKYVKIYLSYFHNLPNKLAYPTIATIAVNKIRWYLNLFKSERKLSFSFALNKRQIMENNLVFFFCIVQVNLITQVMKP